MNNRNTAGSPRLVKDRLGFLQEKLFVAQSMVMVGLAADLQDAGRILEGLSGAEMTAMREDIDRRLRSQA